MDLLGALASARQSAASQEPENKNMKNPASMTEEGGDTIFLEKGVFSGEIPKEGQKVCIYGEVLNTGSKVGISVDRAEVESKEEDDTDGGEEETDHEPSGRDEAEA